MPTSLPPRRDRKPSLLLLWVLMILVACAALEVIDPAPMELAAAWVAAP